jgi:Carboxypeptidase regulatory-like domain
MCKYVSAGVLSLLVAGLLPGQITDPNPAQKPNVFLGGPKEKKDKKATSKSLRGTVTDETGKPLEGALVTLVNTNSKEKWTFITKKDGRYNFDGLSFTVDYEVAAKFKDERSELRKLSQYDHTPSIVRILQVEPVSVNDAPKDTSAAQAQK